jgi:lambda family phage portal protein
MNAVVRLVDQFGTEIPPQATKRARIMAMVGRDGAAYDAASYSSAETRDWNTWLTSPDVEQNLYRDTIVARIRDLVRNDGWASGAITTITDSVIGGDFRLVAKPDWRQLAMMYPGVKFDRAWADEFGNAAEALWRGWAYDPGRWCDGARHLTVPQLFALAFRQELIDGDALAVLLWLPERQQPGRARYCTALQLIDADRLSNPHLTIDTIDRRGGVEIDQYGAAQAYHIRRAHMGDWFQAANSVIWDRLQRETPWGRPVVVHHYIPDRPAQHRGAGGIFRPVLARMRMLAKFDQVELQAAVINAVFAAYIESPYDQTMVAEALGGDEIGNYQMLRSEYHRETDLRIGDARMPKLFPGEKVVAVDSKRPSTSYAPFEGAVLRHLAAATGTSYTHISRSPCRCPRPAPRPPRPPPAPPRGRFP